MAEDRLAHAIARAPFLGRLVDELADDAQRRAGLVVLLDELGHLDQRRRDALAQHEKGEQSADRHRVVADESHIDTDREAAADDEPLQWQHGRLDSDAELTFLHASFGSAGSEHVPLVTLPAVEG